MNETHVYKWVQKFKNRMQIVEDSHGLERHIMS